MKAISLGAERVVEHSVPIFSTYTRLAVLGAVLILGDRSRGWILGVSNLSLGREIAFPYWSTAVIDAKHRHPAQTSPIVDQSGQYTTTLKRHDRH
jgi:hypothetical protein